MTSNITRIGKGLVLFQASVAIFSVYIAAPFFVGNQRVVGQNRESAVSNCKVSLTAPAYGAWTWAANSQVKVYILAADFKDAEVPYLITPLRTWNAVAEATASRVRFVFEGTVSEPQSCTNCLTIMRGRVFEKRARHDAELQAFSAQANQIITFARIVLDPKISSLDALTNAVAHELGHNFGLLDCYSCRDHSTVMNVLRSSGLKGPTECDVAQVKAAYEELKRHVRPAPVTAKRIVDEGEEPVEDDTPIVIPPLN